MSTPRASRGHLLMSQYGKKLTALILGDHKLKGKAVRVGDEHGILVSESCKKHGY